MIALLLFYILIGLLVVLLVQYHISRLHLYKIANQYDGPKAWPIVGNALMLCCKNEEMLERIFKLTYKIETPLRFWLGPKLALFFTNPQHVEKIMPSAKFSHKHDLYDFLKTYLGEGLVTTSGHKHKLSRRHFQPLLSMRFCSDTHYIIVEHMENCLKKLEQYENKGTFDLEHIIRCCFIDMFGDIIMGVKMNTLFGGNKVFLQALHDVYDLMFTRLTRAYLQPNIIYNCTWRKKKEGELYETLINFMKLTVIESWKRQSSLMEATDSNQYKFDPVIDQITTLIQKHPDDLVKDDLIDHVLTFFTASEDTVSTIINFLCVCFGMYPEYQDKAFQEIREVFGSSPQTITVENLSKLEYLERCIKEALRLFPIGPYVIRKTLEDVSVDKWTVPKGCAVIIPIYNLHRDPDQWSNPFTFHPDHFLPEEVAKRHFYAYVPFSAGSRGCVGKTLTNICLKTVMAGILQRFEIEADGKLPDLRLRFDIVVRAIEGYNVRLKPRKY